MKQIYAGIEYDVAIYSYRNYTGQDISHYLNMQNLVIYGSCFSQEKPNSDIFPKDMRGVTFIKCNLMNCLIPEGNTVIDCQTKRFKVQNDLRDWELDNEDKPVKVINEKHWIKIGVSIDPKDIPPEKLASIKELKKVGV